LRRAPTVADSGPPHGPDWQRELTDRLTRREVSALIELYDQNCEIVYGYARSQDRRPGGRQRAYAATRQAFLDVWETPSLLSDVRVPAQLRLLALAHLALAG
jgi:hypothetical protein